MEADTIVAAYSLEFYRSIKPWLQEDGRRRLFFIHETNVVDPKDPAVRLFFLDSPFQKEGIARQIGRLSAFHQVDVLEKEWKEPIERHQREAELIASDAADFGVLAARHMRENFKRPLRSLLAMKGALKGIPAVVIGAGPSLEESQEALGKCKNRAFLVAAGNGSKLVETEPDLTVAICPHNPLERRHPESPLCIQGRAHPAVGNQATWYIPDSHFPLENWLVDLDGEMEGGWTVGNTAVAIAAHLGCNPIVLVGMDFSDKDVSKPDWIQAARWMEEFGARHREIELYKASFSGIVSFETKLISDFDWKERGPIHLDPTKAPLLSVDSKKWALWPDQVPSELLLDPLWRAWEPIFERELMVESGLIRMEQKLALQKQLFLERVKGEHRVAID